MFCVDNFLAHRYLNEFPTLAYFTLFKDTSTENKLNILFVCMVADDNINYLRKFIMLNSKEDWIFNT